MENKKIFFIISPAHGHTNPPTILACELVKRKARVIFYSFNIFKNKIESSGAEFREYPVSRELQNIRTSGDDEDLFAYVINFLINYNESIFPYLLSETIREKPDLILYDVFCLYGKYLVSHLRDNKISELEKIPKVVFFSSTFACKKGVYSYEEKMPLTREFMKKYRQMKESQKKANINYKINIEDPLSACLEMSEEINLVATFKEFQPNGDLFDDSFKFIGCFVSPLRYLPIEDPKLLSILDLFNPVNPLNSLDDAYKRNDGNLLLIYVSLGTVFTLVPEIYEHIINSFVEFDKEREPKSEVRLNQIKVIISLGFTYEFFQNKIQNEKLIIPDNILLLPYAPQIEILQRASVFITHCGMNSASETIKFGVPIIGIPLDVDQPEVANRMTNELKLGIRLNKENLTMGKIRKALHEVFKNDVYAKNMIEFSKISNKHDGPKTGADIIEDFLNK